VELLTSLYLAERDPGEAAADFFVRRRGDAVALLAPLEELRPDDPHGEDLVEP